MLLLVVLLLSWTHRLAIVLDCCCGCGRHSLYKRDVHHEWEVDEVVLGKWEVLRLQFLAYKTQKRSANNLIGNLDGTIKRRPLNMLSCLRYTPKQFHFTTMDNLLTISASLYINGARTAVLTASNTRMKITKQTTQSEKIKASMLFFSCWTEVQKSYLRKTTSTKVHFNCWQIQASVNWNAKNFFLQTYAYEIRQKILYTSSKDATGKSCIRIKAPLREIRFRNLIFHNSAWICRSQFQAIRPKNQKN